MKSVHFAAGIHSIRTPNEATERNELLSLEEAVRASAAGTVWICNASPQTWENKQIGAKNIAQKTCQEPFVKIPKGLLSLTYKKTSLFVVTENML